MPPSRKAKWNFKAFAKRIGAVVSFILRLAPAALVMGIIIFAFVGVKQMLYADPYFQIGRVTVFPSGMLTEAEYAYLEEKAEGRSLLEIDLKEIARTLERNPKVKRAEVMRLLPNQLKVFLATRSPIFQIRLSPTGPYYLVGSDQMVLAARNLAEPNLMILEDFGSSKKSYTTGTLYQNGYFWALSEVLAWIQMESLLAETPISKMTVDPLGNISLILSEGIELRLGKGVITSESKMTLLKALLRSDERSQILYVDLRFQDVIVKKKSLTGAGLRNI